MSFETFLSPLTVGHLTLPNRAIMSSMHTGLEDSKRHFPDLATFYAARAAGGAGLIVTGGYSPNLSGSLTPGGATMRTAAAAKSHLMITDAVHQEGGRIVLQLLHAGRYGYTPLVRGASKIKSPISPFTPRALSTRGVHRTIKDLVRAARLAKAGGYDGVEVMGSEGYLINQFLAAHTNDRTDEFGGSASNRMRFPEHIVSSIRQELGDDFLISYRISLLDLVPDGQTWEEVTELAARLQAAGASMFNTGIGWHEARVPTIVTSVPRAAFAQWSKKLKDVVDIPVAASNRINTPGVAEELLADGAADLVSMARPFLADPDFVAKTQAGRADQINVCIACNQACLDHTFANKKASCMVNPQAGRERTLRLIPLSPTRRKQVAVVGGGPAGLAAATRLAERGHKVTLFEARKELGGQFRLAMQIPGKEEFASSLRYFANRLDELGVDVRLGTHAGAAELESFDHVVLASGVRPRVPQIPGVDHAKVIRYDQLLRGEKTAGARVAIIGAGGIGYDIAEYLLRTQLHAPHGAPVPKPETVPEWQQAWGVSTAVDVPGGLGQAQPPAPDREIFLLQRKEKFGTTLGKTTGWVHKATLRAGKVHKLGQVRYDKIDDGGLHLTLADGSSQVLAVDSVVLCSGQESVREVEVPGMRVIGGADVAAELDAKRAILQATEVASAL